MSPLAQMVSCKRHREGLVSRYSHSPIAQYFPSEQQQRSFITLQEKPPPLNSCFTQVRRDRGEGRGGSRACAEGRNSSMCGWSFPAFQRISIFFYEACGLGSVHQRDGGRRIHFLSFSEGQSIELRVRTGFVFTCSKDRVRPEDKRVVRYPLYATQVVRCYPRVRQNGVT